MKIIAVDDERLALENIVTMLQQEEPESEIISFSNSVHALEYLTVNTADIAFLDIEMGNLNGISLAKQCKELCPAINIIFVTGYSQYTIEAFKLHASGYLMKPVRARDLREEIHNLRNPLPIRSKNRVRVQTFGNFEVFVDGKLLDLPRAKSKECLAYLIDRKGARVTVSELSTILWEDKPNGSSTQNNTHQVIFTLMKALREANVQDIIIKSRRDIAVDTTKIDCDYYAAINGDITQMNSFHGEYMTNYSWAELTLGGLTVENVNSKYYKVISANRPLNL